MNFNFLITKTKMEKINVNLNFKPLSSRLFLFSTGLFTSCLVLFSPLISLAGDPFRNQNARDIPTETEYAFKTLFEDGDYVKAREYLYSIETVPQNDPLLPALVASLAYTEEDWSQLETYAQTTIQTAESIADQDPLRSNLYLAVGHFLDGANQYHKEGAVAAITKLQLVLSYFDKAEQIDSQDPELNLIKGYLNLLLAVHLPFSNPQQAIENLQTYASPQYLVNRGIAVAYRDLDDYDLALNFVNRAIESTPLNPELYYLKGQILKEKGRKENNIELLKEALKNFDIAFAKIDQLPVKAIQKPLKRERNSTIREIEESTTISNK